ncbi:MAG: transposase [Clostridia bacterium]|nr:transposase [Clostridia bacterium]
MENQPQERKATRLKQYSYSSAGAYFITICTEHRRPMLSTVVGGDVLDAPQTVLMKYGEIADEIMGQLNAFYEHIHVDDYVIMPNHVHLLLRVLPTGSSGTSTPTKQHATVPQFVSTFKRFCNKKYGKNIWQRGFYDHIIRNDEDYENHLRYIQENPLRWELDELYAE